MKEAWQVARQVTEALTDFVEDWEAYQYLNLHSSCVDAQRSFDKLSYSFALWATAKKRETMVEYPEVNNAYEEKPDVNPDVCTGDGVPPSGVQSEPGVAEEVPEWNHPGDGGECTVLNGVRSVANSFTLRITGANPVTFPVTLGPGTYTITISTTNPLPISPPDAPAIPLPPANA